MPLTNKRFSSTAFNDNEEDCGNNQNHHTNDNESSKKKVKHENHHFVSYLLYMLIIISTSMTTTGSACCAFTPTLHQALLSNLRSQTALKIKKNKKIRNKWSEEKLWFDSRIFYHLFQMTRSFFKKLCSKIENSIGPKQFKSERYLLDLNVLNSPSL